MMRLFLPAALAAVIATATPSSAGAGEGLSREEAAEAAPCVPLEQVEAGDPILCTGTVRKDGDGKDGTPLTVRLYWDILADTDELHVTAIETARTPEGAALSRFEGLDLRAPLEMNANGFEFIDANFDGHADFRLVEFLPAGPNVAYFHAVMDPATGRHRHVPVLGLLAAPEFDAAAKTVISRWRGDAATHGEDVFAWADGALVLVRRAVARYDMTGACTMTHYTPAGTVEAEALIFAETPEALLVAGTQAPC